MQHRPLRKLLHELHEEEQGHDPATQYGNQWFGTRTVAFGLGDELRPDPVTLSIRKVTHHNLQDLDSFLRDGIRWEKGRYIFETNYSVGFTNA